MMTDWIFPSKIKNKTRLFALITSIQYCTGDLTRAVWQEKEIKRFDLEKEVKLSPSAGDTIMYMKNLKEHTYTHTDTQGELINKLCKVEG